jgi:hypothetical protein
MGWRDRVKKSFGDSEYIGEGDKNLKNQDKERKKGSKRTFIYYPHNPHNPQNPQNPQNRQNEGEKLKADQPPPVRLKNKAHRNRPRRKQSRHRQRLAWAGNMRTYGTGPGPWQMK